MALKELESNVQIEKLVYGGDGLARVDGQVLLLPFVLPDEQVLVSAQRVKTGLLRGAPLEILQPSSHRVQPLCEYFQKCGGCHYQHADYPFQLQQKQSILRETLQRLAGLTYGDEIQEVSGEPWGYRNRIQLHFNGKQSGFRRAGSHDVWPIDHCHISSPLLVEVIAKLATAVKAPQWPAFLRSLEIFTNGEELQLTVVDATRPVAARFFEWCGTMLPNVVPGAIQYPAAGFSFRISRGSFFQVNAFLIEALIQEVLGSRQGQHAVDLYAGVGLFSLPLSKRFERVEAIERGGPAYRDLAANAAAAGPNIRTAQSSAEAFLQGLEETPDLVVADPPRAGLGPAITTELLRVLPAHLAIVSCDAATLSRDLKQLLTAYSIERMTLVDLFPQTYHFETVVHLTSK